MISLQFILVVLLSQVVVPPLPQQSVIQETSVSPGGCVSINKKSPPLFISYERLDSHAWDGRNYVNGVLLRLNNNSNCGISLTVPQSYPGEVPPNLGVANGKLVRLPNARIGSIKSGTEVELYYLIKYPQEASFVLTRDFHVRDSIYLNNGDFILFSVPIKVFKRDGRVLVPFTYDWDSGDAALVVDTEGSLTNVVEHYLIFGSERIPKEVLK